MGYHVSIIRETSNSAVIRAEEVERLAQKFRASVVAPSIQGSDLEVVIPHSDGELRLSLSKGELWSVSPTPAELSIMIELADDLGALVKGDEGETYRTPIDAYQLANDQESEALSRTIRGRRRRGLAIYSAIIAFFVVMALLVHFIGRR